MYLAESQTMKPLVENDLIELVEKLVKIVNPPPNAVIDLMSLHKNLEKYGALSISGSKGSYRITSQFPKRLQKNA
jgi:hypothetical protein